MKVSRAIWMTGAPALVLAAAVSGNDAVEPEAVHATVEMEGGPWVGDNCTGRAQPTDSPTAIATSTGIRSVCGISIAPDVGWRGGKLAIPQRSGRFSERGSCRGMRKG